MKVIYSLLCLGTVIATLSSCSSIPAEPAPPPIGNPYLTRRDFDGDKRSWQHSTPMINKTYNPDYPTWSKERYYTEIEN